MLTELSAVAGTAGLAGCTATDARGPGRETTPPDTTTDDAATTAGELDLREANVTRVSVEPADGRFRLSVTLYHDDDGEDGYADWWQVETLDGERLGRRSLAHPHGTRPFTRSTTVELPTDRVVVRGHDQTHGYGGRAAIVAIPDGAVEFVDQGPERRSFADR